jgi:hypothetical protein
MRLVQDRWGLSWQITPARANRARLRLLAVRQNVPSGDDDDESRHRTPPSAQRGAAREHADKSFHFGRVTDIVRFSASRMNRSGGFTAGAAKR